MENVLTLKNTRIPFLRRLPAETLKIPKSEFHTVNTTSIPITLLSNGSAPLPLAKKWGLEYNQPIFILIIQ